MEAEIVQANEQVVERLSQWPLERLIAEGYTVDGLSAFPYIKRGEKNPSGYTFSFVPPAGDSLGVNLFLYVRLRLLYYNLHVYRRGSQVTVVEHGNSPLDYVETASSKIKTLQGTVLYSSPEEIRIGFNPGHQFDVKGCWRLDVYVSEIGHQRMRAAIEALNYDPETMLAESSPFQEYELHGTYLREELLQGFDQRLSASSDSGITKMQDSNNIHSSRGGLFTSDERIDDWVRRYSLPTPERKKGDPELLLNTSQTQAIAQMIGKRLSLVQGVS
jgi:regulator of nonsense transcripts 1